MRDSSRVLWPQSLGELNLERSSLDAYRHWGAGAGWGTGAGRHITIFWGIKFVSSATTETCRLLLDARSGKEESLGKLLQSHLNYLKLMARTHLDKKLQGRTSPSDVVQETLLEAHRDFPRFRGTSRKNSRLGCARFWRTICVISSNVI